jgi:hypothetical protein
MGHLPFLSAPLMLCLCHYTREEHFLPGSDTADSVGTTQPVLRRRSSRTKLGRSITCRGAATCTGSSPDGGADARGGRLVTGEPSSGTRPRPPTCPLPTGWFLPSAQLRFRVVSALPGGDTRDPPLRRTRKEGRIHEHWHVDHRDCRLDPSLWRRWLLLARQTVAEGPSRILLSAPTLSAGRLLSWFRPGDGRCPDWKRRPLTERSRGGAATCGEGVASLRSPRPQQTPGRFPQP